MVNGYICFNMHVVVLQGQNNDDVYVLTKSSPPTVHNTIKASIIGWPRHLGHPSDKILHHIIHTDSQPLSLSSVESKSCVSCTCNENHWPSFSQSTLHSTSPLELLFGDAWGPAPVESIDGFKYYLIFVDHYFKYIWLYPLKKKKIIFHHSNYWLKNTLKTQ